MRCPVCRADNSQGPQCRRCKADLALLFTVQEQQRQALAEARHCLRQGRLERALQFAAGADALLHDADAGELLAVLHLLRRDYPRAWQACCTMRRGEERSA